MHPLNRLARNLIEEFLPSNMAVGSYYLYRKDGKGKGVPVKVIDGYYLDPVYGRVSNHWTWKRILPSGQMSRRSMSGYGGDPDFKAINKKQALKLARRKNGIRNKTADSKRRAKKDRKVGLSKSRL